VCALSLHNDDWHEGMSERIYAPGQVVYRQGTLGDFAYIIRDGRVELSHVGATGAGRVKVLGPGEIFGEMALVLNRRRFRTATAVEATVVDAVSRIEFLRTIGSDGDELQELVRRLLRSVRPCAPRPLAVEATAAEFAGLHDAPAGAPTPGQAMAPAVPILRAGPRLIELAPASDETARLLDAQCVAIERLPFRVGRRCADRELAPGAENDLTLWDERPYNLSRNHFVLRQDEAGLAVRDSSRLGTYVNGAHIWGWSNRQSVALEDGENEIVAGSDTSPFRFVLRLIPL